MNIITLNIKAYCRVSYYCHQLANAFILCLVRIKAGLLGIKLGKNLQLYGKPFFQVWPQGSIVIGDNCVLRSRTTSNLMGLNHKCMLSATPAYDGTEAKLTIGNNVGMSGITIWCFKSISIGNDVRIGANTIIMDGDAHFDDKRTAPPQEIVIEDDVFIGANCVIKKGVTIGKGAVVGMNSVVTKDIPAGCVAVGVPAKVVK